MATMTNQRHLFRLKADEIYINGAYMSPQLKTVEAAGIDQLSRKANPSDIQVNDFFTDKHTLRELFAKLIEAEDAKRIAIIPSVSFGIATVAQNIPFAVHDEILLLEEQFPSNYYVWQQISEEKKIRLKIIKAPPVGLGRALRWNELILEAITPATKVVSIPHVHWADGSKFDLEKIRKKCNEVGAYLIIDGTQSVGAMPFSVKEIQPDALICGGYKWLMGHYGLGVAYFNSKFDNGLPLDNNWMNHVGSENFAGLVNYNTSLKPKAERYDVGESSNFILVAMLNKGLEQVLEWQPDRIQQYCKSLTSSWNETLTSLGHFIEEPTYRAKHLFGVYLNPKTPLHQLQQRLEQHKIKVSFRGNSVRISPHVYNTKQELEILLSCFK